MSKVLEALDTAISAIGEPETQISGHHWTPEKALVSNDKPLIHKAVGHFGHLGHHQEDFSDSEHVRKGKRKRNFLYSTARARGLIFGVQSVQGVQSRAQQGLNVGHLSNPDVQRCPKSVPTVTESTINNNPDDSLPADLQAVFDERAAIAEFDGGRSRDVAEDVTRHEVAAGPAGDDVTAWRSWMRNRLLVWQRCGLSARQASPIVWSEAECAWSLRHHPAADPNRCAGCGRWMLDAPGMTMLGGAVVHLGGPVQLDCLILYGQEWRATASAGLIVLGLKRPEP